MPPERLGEVLATASMRVGGLAAVLYGCYLVGGAGLAFIAGGIWLILPARYFAE